MSADHIDEERIARLNRVSESLFGEAAEVETAEAEELLKAAGIDPGELKNRLYRRMAERSQTYSGSGRPVPPLLRQALEDLRPGSTQRAEETPLFRTARLGIVRLLREIAELPSRLDKGLVPTFTAAYRNRRELSAGDKKVLDEIGENLRKKAQE